MEKDPKQPLYHVSRTRMSIYILTVFLSIPICTAVQPEISLVDLSTSSGEQHPFLFFSQQDVPRMQNSILPGGTHEAMGAKLKQAAEYMKRHASTDQAVVAPVDSKAFASIWNERYGNSMAALAMYCVVAPDDGDAWALALTMVQRLILHASWFPAGPPDEVPVAHSLTGLVIAVDCLWPRMFVSPNPRPLGCRPTPLLSRPQPQTTVTLHRTAAIHW
eukprot:m.1447478 g.1447478  ORF g.1447478 m.1447478 type:complete len:218 (-) comp25107_c0_seq126:4684-5337(-)